MLLCFIHSHFAVHSAIPDIDLIVLPFMPPPNTAMSDRALQSDLEVNPLAPTSIGRLHAFQPLFQHCSSKSSYFNFFLSWASSICSSQGIINSHIRIFFSLLENIKSGRKDVFTMCSGKNQSCYNVNS